MNIITKFFEYNLSDLSDDDLIEMIKSGDSVESCKSIIINRYYDKLLGYLVNKKTRMDIEDLKTIVHDGLMRAFNKIDLFSGKSKFSSWLFVVVNRVMLNYIDSKKREKENYVISDDTEIEDTNTYNVINKKENDIIFNKVSKYLSERENEWLRLYRMGYTHPQISKEMDMDVSTSKWYKNNIISKIKKWVNGTLKVKSK